MAAGTAVAQDPKVEPPLDTAMVEKQLAKPLTDQAKKLLKAAVKNNANSHTERMKFKLPENSEPCTMYVPTVAVKR
jgi:hypothetical protein